MGKPVTKTHIYKGSSTLITMCLQNAEHLACLSLNEIEERKLPIGTISCNVCLQMMHTCVEMGRKMNFINAFKLDHILTWFPDDLPIITEGGDY